jgi:hypothetical protein
LRAFDPHVSQGPIEQPEGEVVCYVDQNTTYLRYSWIVHGKDRSPALWYSLPYDSFNARKPYGAPRDRVEVDGLLFFSTSSINHVVV